MTRLFLALAAIVSGLIGGFGFNRVLMEMPAWRGLGPAIWAEFSRRADLGVGLFLYPAEAGGAALMMLAAAVSFHFDNTAHRRAASALYAALLLSAAGLVCALRVVPVMLSLRALRDPVAVKAAFDAFLLWDTVRSGFQALAFVAAVWALASLGRKE